MATDRDHDLVLVGATGYVGRLVAGHLARSAPAGTRIALAGRSPDRLAAVRDGLGPAAAGWPLLGADTTDPASMAELAGGAGVVATTVGPYARLGWPLVEACARAGTHYADLTGEVLFVRRSVEEAHDTAVASGARIVHACGYDSVPTDLAVALAATRARGDGAGDLGDTVLLARFKGGFSGGTVDSARTQIDAVRADPAAGAVLADPYALSPDRAGEPDLGDESDPAAAGRDPDGGWTAPFVMGPFNARIVRRSNALTGWSYGRTFRYREAVATGSGPLGALLAAGIGPAQRAFQAAMAVGPTRAVLDRVLPRPGDGPSEAARARGHFRSDVHTTTTDGARYVATVAGTGDPGYAATAVMFGEAALGLALDAAALPDAAGVLTPATALGPVLVERLRRAGLRCSVEAR